LHERASPARHDEGADVQAKLLGEVIAQASVEETVWIDGTLYFPPSSVMAGALKPSRRPYTCPWKGVAQYFDVLTPQSRSKAAAWSYPRPLASAIRRVGADFSDYVAFDPAFVEVG
jgi:uncharacterized protein (DUF427 family)